MHGEASDMPGAGALRRVLDDDPHRPSMLRIAGDHEREADATCPDWIWCGYGVGAEQSTRCGSRGRSSAHPLRDTANPAQTNRVTARVATSGSRRSSGRLQETSRPIPLRGSAFGRSESCSRSRSGALSVLDQRILFRRSEQRCAAGCHGRGSFSAACARSS